MVNNHHPKITLSADRPKWPRLQTLDSLVSPGWSQPPAGKLVP